MEYGNNMTRKQFPELLLCGASTAVAAIFIMFFIFGLIELIA